MNEWGDSEGQAQRGGHPQAGLIPDLGVRFLLVPL